MSNTQSKSILQRAVGAIFLLALIALVALLLLQPSDHLPDSTARERQSQQPTISITANDQNRSPASADSAPTLVLESTSAMGSPLINTPPQSAEVISEDLWQSVELSMETESASSFTAATSEQKPALTADQLASIPPKNVSTPKTEALKPAVTTPKLELIADSERSTTAAKPNTQSNSQPTAKPASHGNWYVQIGAFGNTANAQKLANQYQQQGFNVRIQKDKNLNRVQIGPFASKKEAEQVQARTKTQSINPAVIHLP